MNGYGFQSEAFDPQMINNTPNAQFNNPQFNPARSQTPQQFPYTPQQLVPSKRPRDDAGGAVNSPRQPPTSLPNYLQHGSNNATPSPTLSNQQFRPPSQQPGMAMSPPPDGSGRGTPVNPNPSQFNMNGQMGGAQMGMGGQMAGQMPGQNFNMPTTSMPQGYNQNFANMQNMQNMQNMGGGQGAFPGVQLSANLAQQQAAINRMSLERQRQMMQQRQAGMNPMMQQAAANQPNMGTPTRPQANMANMHNDPRRAAEERAFIEKVAKYMQHAQQPFDAHPVLAGRPVNLFVLFQLISRAGSSKRVTQQNGWPALARNLGVPPEQYPNAGPELQQIFQRNLGPWEAAYWSSQQQRMAQMKQQGQMPGMPQGQQSMSPNRGMPQQVPQQNNQPQNAAYMAQLQSRMTSMQAQQSPAQPGMTPQQSNASLPSTNGWSTPQHDGATPRPNMVDQHRKSASRQLEGSPAQVNANAFPTPPPAKSSVPPESKEAATAQPDARPGHCLLYKMDPSKEPSTIGGIELDRVANTVGIIPLHDADIPGPFDIGILDIQALTLSLQSGIAVEVRYALDILAKVTHDPTFVRERYIELPQCGDLLDVLIDCGEEQVEYLSDESKRIEGLEHGSYEEMARLARLELQEVQDVPEVGSKRYNRARAAERLVAVTSILRNLSFPRFPPQYHAPRVPGGEPVKVPDNSDFMAASRAVKFLAHTIGLLATRVISLQSSINTQDFMKDVIIFLSNTAAEVVLDSQDDAYNLLQFILAFAPGPIPTETNPFRFASYRPSVHKYYPNAIDAFAKLLARDDPNRSFFRQIFVDTADHEDAEDSDLPVHQQYDLLTRAFGMAIAVIPDVSGHERKPLNRMDIEVLNIAAARKPTLSQGMLTADLLSMLIPASDPSLARAWLKAQDGWQLGLFRVVSELAEHDGAQEVMKRNQPNNQYHPSQRAQEEEVYQAKLFSTIVTRSMSMLKRLARKALEDTAPPIRPPVKEESEEAKVNGVADHDKDEDHLNPADSNDEALLDDLADFEKAPAADFLPLSDAIFQGIFANTKELSSAAIVDFIALGEILH